MFILYILTLSLFSTAISSKIGSSTLHGPHHSAPKSTTTGTSLADISTNDVPVVVDFGAEWCGPCKVLDPILEEIAVENKDKVKIYKMNIDENPMTPQKYGIRGIPTIMIFKKGDLIDTKVGSLPKAALETWIQSNL